MSGFGGVMKNGWHPEKSRSGSTSGSGSGSGHSRTGLGIRNKTNSMIPGSKSKQEEADRANHVSAPLSSLKDPNSFAPPPKRTGSGLIPAPPASSTPRKVVAAPSTYHDPRSSAPLQPPPKISSERELQQLEAAPPVKKGPYSVNTTGLSTDNLPKPPARRIAAAESAEAPPPPSYEAATGNARPVPSLPPRLPARTNTGGSVASATSPAPSNGGMLNQNAANRLGAAGVNVPSLGIDRQLPAATNSSPSPPPPPRPGVGAAQVTSLQNRFAKLGTSTTGGGASPAAASPAPAEGTMWQQKQAALQTAQSFQKDPSSVSLSDAKSAASTANNFRQRHGEQVAAGMKSANSLNQKYGIADKVGGLAAQQQQGGAEQQQQSPMAAFAAGGSKVQSAFSAAGKKKPPPPPPKKKPGLAGPQSPATEDAPPPIPTATRPW